MSSFLVLSEVEGSKGRSMKSVERSGNAVEDTK
jgi:hypothetical protein